MPKVIRFLGQYIVSDNDWDKLQQAFSAMNTVAIYKYSEKHNTLPSVLVDAMLETFSKSDTSEYIAPKHVVEFWSREMADFKAAVKLFRNIESVCHIT